MYTRPGWLTEYGNAVEAAQLRYPGIIEAGPGPLIRAGWLKWELSQGRMIAPRSILQGRKIRIANIWVTDRSDRYWRWIRSAAVCLGNTPSLPPLVALVDWLYDDPWDAPSPTDLRIPDEVTADTLFEHLHVASVYRHRLQPMYRSHYAADLYDRTKEMLLAHRQSTGR